MEKIPSWKSNIRPDNQESNRLNKIRVIITVFTESSRWSIYTESDKSSQIINFIFSWGMQIQK